jgi:hypothetical protein
MSKLLAILIPVGFIIGLVLYYLVFTGIIKVDSVIPPGAAVQIDGFVVGTTPVKHRVRTGVHQITISKAGFEIWKGDGKVSGTEPLAISVKLRFLLRSIPPGARVIMDGKYLGETELAINLEQGYHIFEYKKAGYQSAKFKAVIPAIPGEPIPIAELSKAEAPQREEGLSADLVVQEGFGSIQVSSTPDAQVYLDGEFQGETPMAIKKVQAGGYVLTLSREGYRELRQTVYVKKNEITKVAGELKAESKEQ